MNSCRALLSVCLVSASCASIPVTGAAATGAPLEVLETSQTFNVTRKVKVAEVTHRDRVGRKTGTSEVTENRTRRVTEYDWKLMQGDQGVDESDFYRIGGDLERSALVDEKRRGAATLHTLGVLTIPVGIALAVAGVLLAYVPLQTVTDPDTGMPTMAPLLPSLFGYVMVGAGGLLAGGLGSMLINAGNELLAPGVRLLPREEAEAVAAKYNATLK
ncbi:MAG: hypothetical protein Q8L14_11650 [Myxococcales bacterium]|nr:hypothetical protein [Myxococcales bacterium]